MITYLLIVVISTGIGYDKNANVTIHEFKNKIDCEATLAYIKVASQMAHVEGQCSMILQDKAYTVKQPAK